MFQEIQVTNPIPSVRVLISRPLLGHGIVFVALAFAWLALSPQARAVCQEGCDLSNANTFLGDDALLKNTTGIYNTAIGFEALFRNRRGNSNTANGIQALFNNAGDENTATGAFALYTNTTGIQNTTIGYAALYTNTTGLGNTANGNRALAFNTIGNENTAIGLSALSNNTTGSSNIALGINAGTNLTTGSNNIDIGSAGVVGESSKIRIGTKSAQKAAFIAGISGVTVANGVGVIINPQGQLGTVVSSARFKDDIKSMDKASEAILALQPVTFHYKHELDPASIPQFGLVAEQVEKVNPDLVARDEQGKPYTVRYEAVNAMLLNEFLKEHRKVESLEATEKDSQANASRQQREIDSLKAALKEQATLIQKVSDRLEMSKPARQMVADSQ